MWKKYASLLTPRARVSQLERPVTPGQIRIGCNRSLHLFVVAVISLLAGCATLIKKPSSVAWHTCYRPIESVEAHDFLERGIELLKKKHGEPDIPVKKVLLRYAEKTAAASHYDIAERFSLTEIVDAERGVFCLYVGVPPSHKKFYYLLGHEIGHLLHPAVIDDAEEERFCNEFSRQLCEQETRPFKPSWETRKWVRGTTNKHQ